MLLKIFLILVALIIFVPSVRRFLFYLLVGRQMLKEQEKQHARNPPVREGETRVNPRPSAKNNPTNRGGEYVDYEEVK